MPTLSSSARMVTGLGSSWASPLREIRKGTCTPAPRHDAGALSPRLSVFLLDPRCGDDPGRGGRSAFHFDLRAVGDRRAGKIEPRVRRRDHGSAARGERDGGTSAPETGHRSGQLDLVRVVVVVAAVAGPAIAVAAVSVSIARPRTTRLLHFDS